MNAPQSELLTGDSPKFSISDDKFGLDKIADSLASVLLSRVATNGYVIGVEGDWGEGKSSLVNFISEKLSSKKEIHRVIRFEPWLVGSKEALLSTLFNLLAAAIRDYGRDPIVKKKLASNPRVFETALEHLNKYSSALEIGKTAVDAVTVFDVTGYSKFGSIVLRVLASIAKLIVPAKPSLEDLKRNVQNDLQTIKNLIPEIRFTVVIDDLDRLEPSESVEILRLIKAVADFPIVTYVVCFDRSILAAQVQTVLRIKDGHAYLEKIFQSFVPLPPQEPFAIRRYIRSLLEAAFPTEMQPKDTRTRAGVLREEILFDVLFGKFLQTPRDAVRLCEAVKLGWPYLRGQADFLDYVWLQLAKLKCRPLYLWIKEYVVGLGSYRDGGRPGDHEAKNQAIRLREILEKAGLKIEFDRAGIKEFLPGTSDYTSSNDPKVYELAKGELDKFETEKRLGSPSHWKAYFSFDNPSYALDDDLLSEFVQSIESNEPKAVDILRGLIQKSHSSRAGYHFEVFLERLFDRRESLSENQKIGLARALAEVMDLVLESPGLWLVVGPWRRAETFLDQSVAPHFASLVRDAFSINWLSDVLRDQGFAFGRPDVERERPDRQWMTEEQFDQALSNALDRFRKLGIAGILKKPQPLTILFCWKQLGDADELDAAIKEEIVGDSVFLDFLDAMRTWVDTSGRGLYKPLRRENVKNFLDADAARVRLFELANSPGPIGERASDLLSNWENER